MRSNNRFLVLLLVFCIIVASATSIRLKPVYAEDSNPAYTYIIDHGLTILEIQPRRDFVLSKNVFPYELRNHITIKQMSINELNSVIDEVNGKYDVVYMGGYRHGEVTQSGITYNRIYSYKKYDKLESKTSFSNADTYGSVKEYYTGYDITDLKAKKLEDFISSGQLTYLERGIFDNSSYTQQNIPTDTKMYKWFNKYKDNSPSNLIKKEWSPLVRSTSYSNSWREYYNQQFAFDQSEAINLVNTYYSTTRRPTVQFNVEPISYTSGYQAVKGETKTLDFNLDILNPNNGLITINLYVDVNGDGIYKTNELKKSLNQAIATENIGFAYNLPGDFTGLHPWKLEIIDEASNAKYYKTGAAKFRGNDKIEVRVLQIMPMYSKNNFDITNNLVDEYGNNLLESDDYRIHTEIVTTNSFLNRYSNQDYTINGVYDMVIFGFFDCYGNDDFSIGNTAVDNRALDDIQMFIDTYQSVMFTHDTIGYYLKYGGLVGKTKGLTDRFRDIIGQNIYTTNENYSGHTPEPLPDPNKKSYGFTTLSLDRYHNGGRKADANKTFKLNEGLITMYPYQLGNISVSTTHSQYYQLDLEDEQVIPWYTLDSNESSKYVDKYDGRNNYYTYTKGNITFSGTGHSNLRGNNNYDERRLFVNTMIKAIRGANHAPTITVSGITNNQEVPHSMSDLSFSMIVNDVDDEEYVDSTVYIDLNENNAFEEDERVKTLKLYANPTQGQNKLGQSIPINIPRATIAPLLQHNKNIKIKIAAKDPKNADSFSYYTLRVINVPILDLGNLSYGIQCLVGDSVYLTTQINATNFESNQQLAYVSGVTLTKYITNNDNNRVRFDDLFEADYTQWQNNIYEIRKEDIIINDIEQIYDYPLEMKVLKDGNYTLTHNLYYNYSSIGNVRNSSQTINVKTGGLSYKYYDAFHRPIQGVNVRLSILDAGVYKPVITATTNNQGIISVDKLRSGTYQVEVLSIPEGYSINPDDEIIPFTLSYEQPLQDVEFTLQNAPFKNVSILTDEPISMDQNRFEFERIQDVKAKVNFTLIANEGAKLRIPININTPTGRELITPVSTTLNADKPAISNTTTREDPYVFTMEGNALVYDNSAKPLLKGDYTIYISINIPTETYSNKGFKEGDLITAIITHMSLYEPDTAEEKDYGIEVMPTLTLKLLETPPIVTASKMLSGQNKHKEIINITARDKQSRPDTYYVSLATNSYDGNPDHKADFITLNKVPDETVLAIDSNVVNKTGDSLVTASSGGYAFEFEDLYKALTKNGSYIIYVIDESGQIGYEVINVDFILKTIPSLT